jgi:hypothetical protein
MTGTRTVDEADQGKATAANNMHNQWLALCSVLKVFNQIAFSYAET